MNETIEESTIRRNFLLQYIELSDVWLKQCLEWIHTEFPNYLPCEVERKVYEQWLSLDLCEVEIPILPPNIQHIIEMTINKPIHLQLSYVIDISKPKYLQLKRIRNKFDDHMDDSESCGMLKLVLTDGVQEISALEYVKINGLSLNLPPGLKVCLKPPINIRRGQIILKPETIDLIGGCVEELEIPNSVENILAMALDQPLTINPHGDSATVINQNVNETQQTSVTATTTVVTSSINSTTTTAQPLPPASGYMTSEDTFGDLIDDDMFYDHFNAMEEDFIKDFQPPKQYNTKPTAQPSITSYNNELDDDFTSDIANIPEINAQTSHEIKHSPIAEINEPSCSNDRQIANENKQTTPQKRCVLTIEKVNKIKSNVNKGNFTIQAEIEKIIRKLSISEEGFSMKVVLSDDTDEIEAELHSDVLAEIIGYDPEVFTELVYSEDVVQQDELSTVFKELTAKLNRFYAKIVLTVEANKDPIVTSILEFVENL